MTEAEAREFLRTGRAQRSTLAAHGWVIAPIAEDPQEWFWVNEADANLLERLDQQGRE